MSAEKELKKAERILAEPIGVAIVIFIAIVFVIPWVHKNWIASPETWFGKQSKWVQGIVYWIIGGVLVGIGYYYGKGWWKTIAEALGIGFFFAGGMVMADYSLIPVKTK